MSVLFNHAIRHEFLPQSGNPITMVRQSAKRMRAPDILEVSELINLFDQLAHRDRAMVLLDVVTGLRRSELIGLKWLDVNFEELELSVTRSVYRQRVGRCKTEISRKPVPLDPWVAEELLTWKRAAPYNQHRTDDLFHAITATSRNSLKLRSTDRTLCDVSHAFFPLLDLYRTSGSLYARAFFTT
jgi:integrase